MEYGVLKARILKGYREDDDGKSPHYQVVLEELVNKAENLFRKWKSPVNVQSKVGSGPESELLYYIDGNLLKQAQAHRERADLWQRKLAALSALPEGFHANPPEARKRDLALDYVRERYFEREEMNTMPATSPGAWDDLQDYIDFYLRRAVESGDAVTAYVFGACFRAGGFPIGVHDVHMNQGNSGPYARDNGTFQDGGLVLTSRHSSTAVGIFLAFQGQSFNTDDGGHPIVGQGQAGQPR